MFSRPSGTGVRFYYVPTMNRWAISKCPWRDLCTNVQPAVQLDWFLIGFNAPKLEKSCGTNDNSPPMNDTVGEFVPNGDKCKSEGQALGIQINNVI